MDVTKSGLVVCKDVEILLDSANVVVSRSR